MSIKFTEEAKIYYANAAGRQHLLERKKPINPYNMAKDSMDVFIKAGLLPEKIEKTVNTTAKKTGGKWWAVGVATLLLLGIIALVNKKPKTDK